jgi:phosphoribosylformylglycinamidine synthase PurS subunit
MRRVYHRALDNWLFMDRFSAPPHLREPSCRVAVGPFPDVYQPQPRAQPLTRYRQTRLIRPWKSSMKLAAARYPRHRVAIQSQAQETPMKLRIFVTLKNGVLDPQGKAIHKALDGLGFAGINDVRAGKLIELDVADDTSDASIDEMCRKLLANTVIENYRVERA